MTNNQAPVHKSWNVKCSPRALGFSQRIVLIPHIHTLIPRIPTRWFPALPPDSPHSHPDSSHSHPDYLHSHPDSSYSLHSQHFHPDSLHSHLDSPHFLPDSPHSHPHSPHSQPDSRHSYSDYPHSHPDSSYSPHSQLDSHVLSLIPRVPNIPLIRFPDSPFRLLHRAIFCKKICIPNRIISIRTFGRRHIHNILC